MRVFTDAERLRLISMHKHRAGARGLEPADIVAIGFALNRRPNEVTAEILRLRMVGLLLSPSARKIRLDVPRGDHHRDALMPSRCGARVTALRLLSSRRNRSSISV
jgi:hypothetical protein